MGQDKHTHVLNGHTEKNELVNRIKSFQSIAPEQGVQVSRKQQFFPADSMARVWPRRNEAPSKVKRLYHPIPGGPGHGPHSATPKIILLQHE